MPGACQAVPLLASCSDGRRRQAGGQAGRQAGSTLLSCCEQRALPAGPGAGTGCVLHAMPGPSSIRLPWPPSLPACRVAAKGRGWVESDRAMVHLGKRGLLPPCCRSACLPSRGSRSHACSSPALTHCMHANCPATLCLCAVKAGWEASLASYEPQLQESGVEGMTLGFTK